MDDKALLRCQVKVDQEQGWRSTCPVSRLTSISRQLFRVILLRRLHLPRPLIVRNCWCGLPHDSRGHHRAAWTRAVVLGGRGWAAENAARICREAGGRVTTNVMVRDLDMVGPHVDDARRLGTGFLFLAQLAVDTTPVSARRTDGPARRRAAQQDGVAAETARQRNVRTTLGWSDLTADFSSWSWRSKWGGRWSRETQAFIAQLARAKACSETQLMGRRVEHAWRLRWSALMACAAARAVASSMLELPGARGSGCDTLPPQDVEREWRFVGLAG